MSLGQRLKAIRNKVGLTQDEAAKLLGVTFQALSNYERNVRDPDTKLLKRMAELYKVSTDYLLDREPFDLNETEINYDAVIETFTNTLASDPELAEFWKELTKRDDLQIMFKQVKDMPEETIKRIIRYIKMVEDEEAQE